MSESFLSDVSAALSQRYAKKLYNQFNRVTIASSLIQSEKDSQGNAKNSAWDVQMDGATASSYAEGTDVQDAELNVDQPLPAVLSWAFYRTAFQISEAQIDAALVSGGTADEAMRMVDLRVMSNGEKLASVVNSDVWAGTGVDGSGNPTIIGITGGGLTASNYAGISSGTYPIWAGNSLSNGGIPRALTMDLLEQAEELCWLGVSESPTVLVGDPGVIRKYVGLFAPIQRIMQPQDNRPVVRFDTSVMLNQGVEATDLYFKGIPVFRDKDAPEGTLALLNQKYIKKSFLPPSRAAGGTAVFDMEKEGAGSNGDMVRTPTGLPFRVEALAKNGDSYKVMIKTVVQLNFLRRSAHCILTDIST